MHYHLHPFHFVLFKFKDLVVKQHPTKLVHQPPYWVPEKHGSSNPPHCPNDREDWVGSSDTVVGGAIEPDMQMGKVGESVVKEGSGGKSSGRKNGGRQERNIGTWDKSWTDF